MAQLARAGMTLDHQVVASDRVMPLRREAGDRILSFCDSLFDKELTL